MKTKMKKKTQGKTITKAKTDLLPYTYEGLKSMFPIIQNHLMMEHMIYDFADRYTDQAIGQWRMTKVKDYFIVIPPDEDYRIKVETNNYSGRMDRYTFGAALTLLILYTLMWQFAEKNGWDSVGEFADHCENVKKLIYKDKRFDMDAIIGFLD